MERSTIFNGKIHYKWPFSIAMLVHQRVPVPNTSSFQYPVSHRILPSSRISIVLRLSFEVRRLAGDRSKRGVGSSQKLPGDASGLRSSPKLSKMLSWRKGDDLEIDGNNKQDANTIKIIKYHNYKIMKESKRRLKSQNTLCKTQ